uniref:Uncharacterized protein n=1 Tax=Human herpesvirus 2 TaxID=10310 RepID=A0A481TX99_HHV2|nr:hypothetical protein [Human alphaherpesvirus 2]
MSLSGSVMRRWASTRTAPNACSPSGRGRASHSSAGRSANAAAAPDTVSS